MFYYSAEIGVAVYRSEILNPARFPDAALETVTSSLLEILHDIIIVDDKRGADRTPSK